MNEPLTINECADFLKISRYTMSKIISDGKISYSLVGRSKRFKESDIEKYLNENTVREGKE